MARITGTRRSDFLGGTSGADEIFGFQGNDAIDGGGGLDFVKGGRGNDAIGINAGIAFGGVGNDTLGGDNATLGGGPGADLLFANGGALYGDEVPGERAPRVGGADILSATTLHSATMTGGGGADNFFVNLVHDGLSANAEILDFHAGTDKVGVAFFNLVDGVHLDQTQVFSLLDANHDLVLNGLDAPAFNSGPGVWFDAPNNRLVASLEATENGIGNDRDHLIINNVDHINAADWVFSS